MKELRRGREKISCSSLRQTGKDDMEKEQQRAAIEAILFTMGDAVEASRLAQTLEISVQEVKERIEEMADAYESEDRGIRILRLEDSYQLCTKKEYYEILIRIARIPKKIHLTDVLMETLAIIAYKQPVTKLEIEKIRGVKSDHAVNRLVEYELVTELGRLDAPGRPILFGTSENFLRHFGIDSLEDLPGIDPVRKEDFKLEAEQEVDARLGSADKNSSAEGSHRSHPV